MLLTTVISFSYLFNLSNFIVNKNKAKDPFHLKAEHFIYASSTTFVQEIAKIINKIFKSNCPEALSVSVIIPLVKSYNKSLKDPNNYRGISLIPILTKILENIILEKCPSLKSPSTSQFGFTHKSSTTHAELLIQDTIKYYNSNGSPLYICSLDATKAFDSCNWYKLFEKLDTKGHVPKPILKFLIDSYLKSTWSVVYGNTKSKSFNFHSRFKKYNFNCLQLLYRDF